MSEPNQNTINAAKLREAAVVLATRPETDPEASDTAFDWLENLEYECTAHYTRTRRAADGLCVAMVQSIRRYLRAVAEESTTPMSGSKLTQLNPEVVGETFLGLTGYPDVDPAMEMPGTTSMSQAAADEIREVVASLDQIAEDMKREGLPSLEAIKADLERNKTDGPDPYGLLAMLEESCGPRETWIQCGKDDSAEDIVSQIDAVCEPIRHRLRSEGQR